MAADSDSSPPDHLSTIHMTHKNKVFQGHLGGSMAQVMIQGPGIESHIGLPTGGASPSAYVSASLSLMNK